MAPKTETNRRRDQTTKLRGKKNKAHSLSLGNVEDGFDDMDMWPDGVERAT